MVQTMNTPLANPFSGLKAALATLLSGGWRGLVMHLLFYRRIQAALGALESLFAQWQAGTLPAIAPRPPAPARTPAPSAPRPQSVPRAPRARRLAPRRRPVTTATSPSRRAQAPASAPLPIKRTQPPEPHPTRSRKNPLRAKPPKRALIITIS